IHWTNHRLHRDPVFPAEFKIAFVMRGHRHDGAGAVAGKHEVAHPHRHHFAAERIECFEACIEAFLFDIAGTLLGARIDHALRLRAAFGAYARGDDFVFGRKDHAGGTVYGVDTGGENANRAVVFNDEVDFGAFAAADPVALHGEDALRPSAFQLGDVAKQLIG